MLMGTRSTLPDESLAGAGVIAFAVGIVGWLRGNLDAVLVIGGFIVSLFILVWSRKAHPTSTIAESAVVPELPVNPKPPVFGITLHDTFIEPYVAGLNYPRKVRLYLSNDGSDIDLGKGNWIADGAQLQPDKPPTCEYEVKDHLGKWSGEAPFKSIPSGKWFRLYVGLDSKIQEEQLKAMAKDHSLGVLRIPARVDDTDVVIAIRP
jgi:hypothetical protein